MTPSATAPSGYADDVLEICRELDLDDVVFVGHSVSAMIGLLAAVREPSRFAKLVMVGPSPRYIDDEGYVGGFSARTSTSPRVAREQLPRLVERHGPGDHGERRPARAGRGAHRELLPHRPGDRPAVRRVTFLSDNRADLGTVTVPTLVLQCTQDVIAPVAVGEYVRDAMPAA